MQSSASHNSPAARLRHLQPYQAKNFKELLRLERHQGEYWILTLMLAGLKTQWSRCVLRKLALYKYPTGFFADQLHDVLAELPAWLWPDKRRKRSYLNQVLARAEMHSTYQPARRLWGRARYGGYYVPNPTMQLRVGEAWQPLREVLALDWIDRGCGRDGGFTLRPRELLDRLEARANDDRDGDASAG